MNRRDFIAALAAAPVLPELATDDQAPTRAAKPLAITILGTGTPAPSLKRQSSGYLIEVGQATGLLAGRLAEKRPEDLPG